jgi:hypothetical protein
MLHGQRQSGGTEQVVEIVISRVRGRGRGGNDLGARMASTSVRRSGSVTDRTRIGAFGDPGKITGHQGAVRVGGGRGRLGRRRRWERLSGQAYPLGRLRSGTTWSHPCPRHRACIRLGPGDRDGTRCHHSTQNGEGVSVGCIGQEDSGRALDQLLRPRGRLSRRQGIVSPSGTLDGRPDRPPAGGGGRPGHLGGRCRRTEGC